MMKATHGYFQWNIKQSQLIETSHATEITTKHTLKTISKHDMLKSRPQSTQASIASL